MVKNAAFILAAFFVFGLILFSGISSAVTETWYYRSDNHTVNGLNAYKLGTTNSNSAVFFNSSMRGANTGNCPSGLSSSFMSDVYIRRANGVEILLASNVAQTSRDSNTEGYQTSSWNILETTIFSSDAIKIVDKIITGSRTTTREFISAPLNANKLNAATWNFTRYTKYSFDCLLPVSSGALYVWEASGEVYHGDSSPSYDTRIVGISYETAPGDINWALSPSATVEGSGGNFGAPNNVRDDDTNTFYGLAIDMVVASYSDTITFPQTRINRIELNSNYSLSSGGECIPVSNWSVDLYANNMWVQRVITQSTSGPGAQCSDSYTGSHCSGEQASTAGWDNVTKIRVGASAGSVGLKPWRCGASHLTKELRAWGPPPPSLPPPPYIDCGLRVFDGTQTVTIACESGTPTLPLRIRKGSTTYGIVLVPTTDSQASKVRISTSLGIKALRKWVASDDADGDGYSVAAGDCNDNVANINPGAAEIYGNSIDEDCNSITGYTVDVFVTPYGTWKTAQSYCSSGGTVRRKYILASGTACPGTWCNSTRNNYIDSFLIPTAVGDKFGAGESDTGASMLCGAAGWCPAYWKIFCN